MKYGIYAQIGDRQYLADTVSASDKEVAKKLAESRRDRLDNQSKHERMDYPKDKEIIYFVKEIPRATPKTRLAKPKMNNATLNRMARGR